MYAQPYEDYLERRVAETLGLTWDEWLGRVDPLDEREIQRQLDWEKQEP